MSKVISPHLRFYPNVQPTDIEADQAGRGAKLRCPDCNLLFMNDGCLLEHKPTCNPKLLRYDNQKGLLAKGSPYQEVTMTTK